MPTTVSIVSVLLLLACVNVFYQLNFVSLNVIIPMKQDGRQQQLSFISSQQTRRNAATGTSLLTTTRPAGSTQQPIAGLSCQAHGGPDDSDTTALRDVIYWKDIPSDSDFVPPLKAPPLAEGSAENEYYLTFENDEGGWNNIRMAMENSVMIAIMTGRTLVLPPEQDLYLLMNDGGGRHKARFTIADFFPFASLAEEYPHFRVITFQEFLERVAMKGKLHSVKDGRPVFPPGNRTDWNGLGRNWESTKRGDGRTLWTWVRQEAALDVSWDNDKCVAAFPAQRHDKRSIRELDQALQGILNDDRVRYPMAPLMQKWTRRAERYTGNPTPVDATVMDRLAEMLANRRELCIYDQTFQDAKVIHLKGEQDTGHRLLTHFYAFLFFENFHHDLWVKRFVRDHLRYVDEIQCAAARVVRAVRRIAKSNQERDGGTTNADGSFDSFHIRRNDFQYKDMHLSAEDIYENNTKGIIKDRRTVYVATDEKNLSFFQPLREHYYLVFLNDFKDELGDLNVNFLGMVDQLVAARGVVFFGAFFSTFTGYINRIRGYHSQNEKLPGYEQGLIDSYYYVPRHLQRKRAAMRAYHSVKPG